jgi:hypothetical protein
LLLADEREETLVVFMARGALLRVRAHPRHALVRPGWLIASKT